MIFDPADLIKPIAAVVIVGTVAASGYYLINLKSDLEIAKNDNKILMKNIDDQKKLVLTMQAEFKQISRYNQELRELVETQRAEVDSLIRKFNQDSRGGSRDFGMLAREKPKLIENIINHATDNARRCLEIVTGSPRTEKELAAVTSSDINKECPSIANPNYKPGVPR